MAEAGQWLEISVAANAESVDAVCDLLSRYGYNDGVVIEEPYRQDADGDNLEIDPTRPVMVRAYLPVDAGLPERKRAIDEGLWHLQQIGGVGPAETRGLDDEDWANAWKQHFPVLRIGRRFVVRPSWRDYAPRDGDLLVHLDPGMAFGTGLHPSTELCMLFMEELDLRGQTVLDVGAGSGILSIAAIRAGAASAVAVEIDAVAAKSLRANLALNDMQAAVDVIVGDAREALPAERQFPVVIANMISRILVANAPAIAPRVAPDGVLIASGVIEAHEQLVVDAYAAHGLRPAARKQGGDWVGLRFERESA